ncbi:MAG: restriction endonuclease subunit S [Bacteroidales bacterium]|nr:restriction endonuclease subunit S [Bacteroidales bacterium]MBR6930971.1 restriction endonuclease subunit S [Bacteroidales bacterium]
MELKKYKLSDIAKIDISSVDKKTNDNETAVKLCNFTDVYYNWAITKELTEGFMEASANAKEIERYTIKKGQVAFTKDSETRFDIGIPTYIADDFEDVLLGYHCALVTPDKKKVDGKYLNAFMHSAYIQKYFENSATGSGQRYTLSIETIENMPILLPSLEEQKRIGDIFSSIDRKISLNRAINRNLEALAKQLYDYWFVQFDFSDENGKPYKSSGGKMVWNEDVKMNIPYNWEVCGLNDFIGKNNTGDWGNDEPSGDSIEIGCIRGADIVTLNDLPKRYIKSNKTEKLLSNWDVVIEVSGGSPVQATGRSAFITPGVIERNGGSISCSNFCHAFSFKDYRYSAYFFYVWNMFYDNDIMFNYEGKTSGIKNFMTETFLANKWIKAPEFLVAKFFDVVKEIYAKIDASIAENNSLTRQRDELLPLLMNGQVEIGN